MVKIFSVDWMAQSHSNSTTKGDQGAIDHIQTQRPHVPCMVQPRQPTSYEKGYLQLKPKTSQHSGQCESSSHRESDTMSSPLRGTNCSPPPSASEISGYSSGYESEAASSECPSVEEEVTEVDRDAAQRRVRTKFSAEQINRLERIFNKHKYLDAGERIKTAEKLKLSETQVRTWFQNRRMKLKRDVQDIRADFLAPAMFQAVPQIQYPGFGGQRLQYVATNQAFYPAIVPQFPMQQHRVSHHPTHVMMHNPLFY